MARLAYPGGLRTPGRGPRPVPPRHRPPGGRKCLERDLTVWGRLPGVLFLPDGWRRRGQGRVWPTWTDRANRRAAATCWYEPPPAMPAGAAAVGVGVPRARAGLGRWITGAHANLAATGLARRGRRTGNGSAPAAALTGRCRGGIRPAVSQTLACPPRSPAPGRPARTAGARTARPWWRGSGRCGRWPRTCAAPAPPPRCRAGPARASCRGCW